MKLYDLELSGNCYKVRLFAALAKIELELVPVDFMGGEHKRPPLTNLNPWGELPILPSSLSDLSRPGQRN
jgi:glutathione S-transferase